MARCRSGVRRRGTARKVLCGLIALSLFTLHVQQSLAIEANGQVFIQTDNELKYMIDVIPLPASSSDALYRNVKLSPSRDRLYAAGGGVHFFPTQLDFSRQPVGMPKMEQVTVVNSDPLNSLHLLSISGSTVHFHCSFFQDKMVPPGGNTSFDVVFLARQIGKVENTLYIHTSQGTFKYQVFGVGSANPYRLKPLIGARVPVNSTFSPVIHMHNPHSTPLQVIEMFTSGGDLHLELPLAGSSLPIGASATQYANASFWELKPYETRPLMRASFVGRVESNHTAYIRIRTSRDSATSELLVLPLEVEVTSDPGLYSPLHTIDFGIMRAKDSPQQQKLLVLSSLPKSLKIASVAVIPPNDAVSVMLEEPMRVHSGLRRPTSIATVTFDPSRVTRPRLLSGKIIVKTKTGGHSLVIPYSAEVVQGDLTYNEEDMQFYAGDVAGDGGSISRRFRMTSKFENAVVVTHVALRLPSAEYQGILQVSHPTLPFVLPAKLTSELLDVTYTRPRKSSHLSSAGKLTVPLILYTNVSVLAIPLSVYDGKLKVEFQHSEKELDFGTLGFGESRILYFTLVNENPVNVVIQELFATAGLTTIELHAIETANTSVGKGIQKSTTADAKRQAGVSSHVFNSVQVTTGVLGAGKDKVALAPYDSAVFRVNLTAPSEEAIYSVDARVTTNYETFFVPIRFQATEGSVRSVPERIVFEKAFPGKVLFKVLKIRSSFAQHTQVTKISFVPSDPRFYYKPSLSTPAILEPYEDTAIGLLYFDASRTCGDDCYVGGLGVGAEASSTRQQQWLQGLRLDYMVMDVDQYLYARRRMKWEELVYYGRHVVNVTVQIDTDPVRGFLFPVQAKLQWPNIIKERKVSFPVTQIGNLSVESVAIENPLDVPLLIQILPVSLYPNPTFVLDLIESSLMEELDSYIEIEDTDVFTLQNLEIYNRAANNPVTKYRRQIETATGVEPHELSIATILSPGVRVNVLLGFEPRDAMPRSSVILVRNNLTIIDALIVQGKGAYSEVVVSEKPITTPAYSRPYDSSLPSLVFNLNERVMQNCDVDLDTHLVFSGKVMKVYRSSLGFYMVKKTFIVQNLGELPVLVQDLRINDEPCRDAGFEVLTCEGFELPANGSRKIDISYVPDFSQPITTASLNLETSAGDVVNTTLRAVTPARLLGRCAGALQRPFWESFVLRCCVFVSALTFAFVFAIAYVDMRRLFDMSSEERSRSAARGTVFSLAPMSENARVGGQGDHAPTTGRQGSAAAASSSGSSARRPPPEAHHHGKGKRRQNNSEAPSGHHGGGGAAPAPAMQSVKPAVHKADGRGEAAASAARRSSGGSSSGAASAATPESHRGSTDDLMAGLQDGVSDLGSAAGSAALFSKALDKHGKRAKRRAAAAAAAAAAASSPAVLSTSNVDGGSSVTDPSSWLNDTAAVGGSGADGAAVVAVRDAGSSTVPATGVATAAAVVAPTRRATTKGAAKDGKKAADTATSDGSYKPSATAAAFVPRRALTVPASPDADAGAWSSGGEELSEVLFKSADTKGMKRAPAFETAAAASLPKGPMMKAVPGRSGLTNRPLLRLTISNPPCPTSCVDSLSSSSDSSAGDPIGAQEGNSFSRQRAVPVARCPANARGDAAAVRSTLVSASASSPSGAAAGLGTADDAILTTSKKPEAAAWRTRPSLQQQQMSYLELLADKGAVPNGYPVHQQPLPGACRPQRSSLPESRTASYDQRQRTSTGKFAGIVRDDLVFAADSEFDDTGSESALSPDWDMPERGYNAASADDFTDISNQTAAFASEQKCFPPQTLSSTATAAVMPVRRHSSLGLSSDGAQKNSLSPNWLQPLPLQPTAVAWPSPVSPDTSVHRPGPIGSRPVPSRRDRATTLSGLSLASLGRTGNTATSPSHYGNPLVGNGSVGNRVDQPLQRANSLQRQSSDLRQPLLGYEVQQVETDFAHLSPPLSENWLRIGQHSGSAEGVMPWQSDAEDTFCPPLPDILTPSSAGPQDLLEPGPSPSPWSETNWSIWSSPQTQMWARGAEGTHQETTNNFGLLGGYGEWIWQPMQHSDTSAAEEINAADAGASGYSWSSSHNSNPNSNTEK